MKRSLKKLELAKATAPLSEVAQDLNGVALVLTVRGRPVAALVPVEGMDWESLTVGTSPDFLDLIERSRRNYRDHGGYSSAEIRREFGLPPPRQPKANANAGQGESKGRQRTGKRRQAKAEG